MQQDTIQASFDRMTDAWAAGDAEAFAAEFTEGASYVLYVGLTYFGRTAIRDAHLPVFQRWQKGTRLSMAVLDTRIIADGVAVVTTEGGIGKGRTIKHNKVQTFVMVESDHTWRCAAFQNTKKNRLFIAGNQWAERRAVSPRPLPERDASRLESSTVGPTLTASRERRKVQLVRLEKALEPPSKPKRQPHPPSPWSHTGVGSAVWRLHADDQPDVSGRECRA
jgi:uncharacterized protein (TIGR02246 family)